MGTAQGYTTTAKCLHWLVVALLIAQFIFAWTMPHIGRNTPVTTLISLHFTFGIIVLIVGATTIFSELQSALDRWHVASTVIGERDVAAGTHKSSLVLGRTFFKRRSRLTANRSARANALNRASI